MTLSKRDAHTTANKVLHKTQWKKIIIIWKGNININSVKTLRSTNNRPLSRGGHFVSRDLNARLASFSLRG